MVNGDIFEGEFVKGLKEGKGLMKGHDGSKMKGFWKENKIYKNCEYIYSDGTIFVGEFKNDKKEGYGVQTWTDGRKYEGTWKNSKMHGVGYFTNQNKEKKKGEWVDGKRIHWIEEKTKS